jgi:hypothetical protein
MLRLPLSLLAVVTLTALMATPVAFACDPACGMPDTVEKSDPPRVQLAICLDTSGSMSGLINSARQKLWTIVNDLATADPMPEIEIALLSFGNDGHNPEDGWVSVICPLTGDLDKISENLFALTTNGGTELVGRVLDHAVDQLSWEASDDALKLIFVCGNESANQDTVRPFREVCKKAIARGLMVNSVYCSRPEDGTEIPAEWRDVAALADGHFASIDQDHGMLVLTTPFDKELATLSGQLNGTYIPYGVRGKSGAANQQVQDSNAIGLNDAAAAERCGTKAWYNCASWDLVDALAGGDLKLADLKDEELPEEMRGMSLEEKQAHVEEKKTERDAIREKVNALQKKREADLARQMKEDALSADRSFDLAIRKSIRAQAAAKGLRFSEALPESISEPNPEEETTSDAPQSEVQPAEPVVAEKISDC